MARRVVVIDDDDDLPEESFSHEAVSPESARGLASRPTVFLPADPPRNSRVGFLGEGGENSVTVAVYSAVTKSGAPRKRPKVELVAVPATILPVEFAVPVLAWARRLALDTPTTADVIATADTRSVTGVSSAVDTASAVVDPAAAFWGTAAVLALGLVARGRLLPGISPDGGDAWRIGPFTAEDTEAVRTLAAVMPPAARAVPVPGAASAGILLPEAEPLLRTFLDAVADVLPRTPGAARMARGDAYAAPAPTAVPHLRRWAGEVAAGIDAGVRVSLRIEPPDAAEYVDDADADADADDDIGRDGTPAPRTAGGFRAITQLHDLADPTVLRDLGAVWPTLVTGRDAEAGARTQIEVLLSLRRAMRVWPPLARLLAAPVPAMFELADAEVFDLLGDAAPKLSAAGVDVHFPKELARELTAQAVLEAPERPGSDLRTYFDTGSLMDFRWRLALGGEELTEAEMDRVAEAARPLVRLRDRWVLVDEAMARRARARHLGTVTAIDALGVALTGTAEVDGRTVPVAAGGWLADLRARIADPAGAAGDVGQPAALRAALRGYQLRGLSWLVRMTSLGLGGCLADDMGLGKTITLIALHLHRGLTPATSRPTLVVCPTSLVGNWEREIERFAPGTPVRRFHGPERDLDGVGDGEFVLTTYGTLRLDAERLGAVDWGLLAADEAQNVKNPYSRTAKALRTVRSQARIALTGTPVENNLSELWALLDWTTPGLLGSLPEFRSRYARAVEADRDPQAAARLAALVKPFLLRRRKSDPGIAPELPPKTESDHPVALTREQAVLYEAFVREMMGRIASSSGIDRRGLILKLLTALKQICNHPAQYLKESADKPLAGRSGKLDLLDELVETIVAEDNAVLVFSQYVQMNRLIERHLAARGVATQFLHGQTPVREREAMVRRFQDGEVPVFLLSLKAAGVGLNLTRAGHVVHYDRWWNPAVEEQATDRAYRIGQTQPVQVHRLIAEGTVEDRIAQALKEKRDLAEAVLTGGEAAFTELSDAELAELVTLRRGR